MNENISSHPDECWKTDIQDHLSFLTKNLTSLEIILVSLVEHGIISQHEYEIITSERTTVEKNWKFLTTLRLKGWLAVKSIFIQVLRETSNDICADIIQNMAPQYIFTKKKKRPDLKSKWWPKEKTTPKSFYERKAGNEFLTEKLKNLFSHNDSPTNNHKVIISGLGGVEKSTSVIWFCHQYEDDYDYILWLDCGDGNLLHCFKNLARVLKVEDRQELDLEELADHCFAILREWKCLFIFDDAECYKGAKGIRNILPDKRYQNFDIIITSRNKEWGHATGDGEIPQYQMTVFEKNESIAFMMENLNEFSEENQTKLEALCDLLGNLPLALQIAVATLNRQKIKLNNYIGKIKKTDFFLLSSFDDYERTINNTMQVSLNLVQNQNSIGVLAYRILTTFAYITANDVDWEFFFSVEDEEKIFLKKKLGNPISKNPLIECQNAEIEKLQVEVKEAINLLENYSLVTITNPQAQNYTVTIPRLLQQVIRQNEKLSQTATIRKILNCERFLEYKLIPLTYADEGLLREFAHLKAELIDKVELNKFLKEKRFHEAVELSRLIKDAQNTPLCLFNYAMCLKNNFETEDAKTVLEFLLEGEIEEKRLDYHYFYFNPFGIVNNNFNNDKATKPLTRDVVTGQLFLIHVKQKQMENAKKIFGDSNGLFLPILSDSFNDIVYFVNCTTLSSYFLKYDGIKKYLFFLNSHHKVQKKFHLSSCVIDENTPFPNDLVELTLHEVVLQLNIFSMKSPLAIRKLTLKNMTISLAPRDFHSKDSFDEFSEGKIIQRQNHCENSLVDISILPPSVQILVLKFCTLSNCSFIPAQNIQFPNHLQELTLDKIKIQDRQGNDVKDFDISHFIPSSLNKFKMSCFSSCFAISLDRLKTTEGLYLKSSNLVASPGNTTAPKEINMKSAKIIDANNIENLQLFRNDFIDLNHIKNISLEGMSIDLGQPLTTPETVTLKNVKAVEWQNDKWIDVKIPDFVTTINISHLIHQSLTKVEINCFRSLPLTLSVSLHHLKLVKLLNLQYCHLIFSPDDKITPLELTLKNIAIVNADNEKLSNVLVNDFIEFEKLQDMNLEGMSIDLSNSLQIPKMTLSNTKIFGVEKGKWLSTMHDSDGSNSFEEQSD